MTTASTSPTAPPTVHLVGRATARRNQLVNAAARAMGERGVAATSIRDIAVAAGVAPGLIHYHFSSREALLVAVVGSLDAELSQLWSSAIAGADQPELRLRRGLAAIAAHAELHPERRRLLVELSVVGLADSDVGAAICHLDRHVAAAIETELQPLLGGEATAIAAAITAAIDGIALHSLLRGEQPHLALSGLWALLSGRVADTAGSH